MAMDPSTAMLLAGLAQGALGGIQSANSGKMTREQLAAQERQYGQTLRQNQAQQALMATQMDPLLQQRSRQRSAGMEQLLRGLSSPTLNVKEGRFDGGARWTPEMSANIASFFSPEARQNAEAQFALNATAASGGQYAMPSAYPGVGNFAGVGYQAPGGGPAAPTTPMPTAPRLGGGMPGRGGQTYFDDNDLFNQPGGPRGRELF